jgi:hypothetical protein
MNNPYSGVPSSSDAFSQSTLVWIKFQVVGFHFYPNAPDDVSYLRDNHRHVFNFKVTISVTHDEREIEFHQFKRELQARYSSEEQFGGSSCETIAKSLLNYIVDKYKGHEFVSVEVSEDDECGSVVTWERG